MSLTPGFLVAAPALRCPFFHHTVVLLVDDSDEGSFGFVINKPTTIRFEDILTEVGIPNRQPTDHALKTSTSVLLGGPVSPEAGWIVYNARDVADIDPSKTIIIDDRIACCASLELLKKIAEGGGPERSIMLLGYAGWGAGQLEQELTEGSWIHLDLDEALLFDTPPEQRWTAAFTRLGIDPSRMVDGNVASA